MAKSNMDQDILKVLLTEEEIKARVEELGSQLYDRFAGEDPLFVGVLNGCFIFMADLVRAAQLKSELEFIGLSSYQDGTKSSGVVQITRDLQSDITDRDIIVVEDILDSGNTLAAKRPSMPTTRASSCPTSSWWATGWTMRSSTATCRISACSSPRYTANKAFLCPAPFRAETPERRNPH